jgi:UDP-N-acetylmuramoyl-tripeptide--D-alanyl-D-alanine ligase
MIDTLKEVFYFYAASYFKFFAQIKLSRWKPRIVVVTGSSGKTTLLHFVESQLKSEAVFSHHANSAIGVPFDILGLHRKTLKPIEWISLVFSAPFKAFSTIPNKNIYVAEADCDRPGEGKFLAEFLKPEVTLWVSLSRTHSVNYDSLVSEKKYENVEDAISYEYGYFLENTFGQAIINGDNQYIFKQTDRSKAKIVALSEKYLLNKFTLLKDKTEFIIRNENFSFNALLPKEIFYDISMVKSLCEYFKIDFDPTFSQLELPTGRTSVYKGVKNTTLVDSSYNANLSSMEVILNMFEIMNTENKWVVLGDMKELGKEEKEEHEKLAEILSTMKLERVLLLGPAITKYTAPKLKEMWIKQEKVISFDTHAEVLKYLKENITGGETILFKASQSLVFDGFIQNLLENPDEIKKLPRRETFWNEYRAARGL